MTEYTFFDRLSVLADVIDGNYQEALATLSSGESDTYESLYWFIPKAQLYAQISGLLGNHELERTYYDSARNIAQGKIEEHPEDARFRSALGIAYAGLGSKEDAIREGRKAVELLPISKEAYGGTFRVEDLARIYVIVGDYDAAIDQLHILLSRPSRISIPLLLLDPAWTPLRDHPRFKRFLKAGR